jgi:mRNA interferase MazF
MEKFVKGDIVVVPFPFSDLTNSKKRPAMVLADLKGDDIILCQITSKNRYDAYSIILTDSDFEIDNLHQTSNIRPNRIFTADKQIILRIVARVNKLKLDEVRDGLWNLLMS